MALQEHPKYLEEKQHLEDTIDYVESAIAATAENREKLRDDIREAFVDLDPLDSSLSYVRIMTDAKFLDTIEENFKGLVKTRKNPYFCRIDFQPEGTAKPQELYIGKMPLVNAEDDTFVLVDWRAPVASVYYDGRLGDVSYETPSGTMQGNLSLKRQYSIRNGQLENIMDIDITTTDAFLQAALGENKDNRLKDIVSTIQAEQNAIVRADINHPLIVQGAAGSGKTTIALHRLAYLIYTYEATFDPDQFLILAPNRLFLHYISDVLPELGADEVRQSTFSDLVMDMTGIYVRLAGSDEKLTLLLDESGKVTDEEKTWLRQAAAFKGSMVFRDIMDRYIGYLEQAFLPREPFQLQEHVIYSVEELERVFYEELAYLPVHRRVPELKKTLRNRLKRALGEITHQVIDSLDRQIQYLRDTQDAGDARREATVSLMDRRDETVASLKRDAKTLVDKFLRKFPKQEVLSCYRALLTSPEMMRACSGEALQEKFLRHFCETAGAMEKRKHIEYEDLTCILYLQHRLFGFEKRISIKYMVVDEAQDFSLFQFHVLKVVFGTQLFTILGDLAQGIHSYRGITDWQEMMAEVFPGGNARFLALEQSYRTTVEIMDLANEIIAKAGISGLIPAKPVVRHGKKPGVARFSHAKDALAAIAPALNNLKDDGYSTIAIIGKTAATCQLIHKHLLKEGTVEAVPITSTDVDFHGGAVIVPAYLAKGLEFDAVLLCVPDGDFREEELDLKLLYVAMTRALHRLDILCLTTNMSLLST